MDTVTEHAAERDCWCQPTLVPATDDGVAGPVVVVHRDTMDTAADEAERVARVFEAMAEIHAES